MAFLIIFPFVIYYITNVESSMSNLTSQHAGLPEITEGESCITGRLYKMLCNTCRCGLNNALICTKVACLDGKFLKELNDKKAQLNLREKNKTKLRKTESNRSKSDVKCISGEMFKIECNYCFCLEGKATACTKINCDRKKLKQALSSSDSRIERAFRDKIFSDLPVLPHTAAKCVPGKLYRVECNTCFCTTIGDLSCTLKLCITIEGINHVTAVQQTGKPCTKGYVDKLQCIKCKCEDSKTKCSAISSCKPIKRLPGSLPGQNIKLSLNAVKEKCVPHMIYSLDCNDCYCQDDGSLLCTQRFCLSWSESKGLEEQRIYLEKYGP